MAKRDANEPVPDRDFRDRFEAAVAAHRRGDLESAIVAYERLERERPADADVLSNLAAALRRAGRRDEALACFQRLTDSGSATAETWFNFGNLLVDLERFDAAESAFLRALDLAPGLHHAATNLANLLARLGRADEALGFHQRAIGIAPSNVPSRRALARLSYGRGDLGGAEEQYRALLRIAPTDVESLNALGVVLKDLGRSEEAVGCWIRAIKSAPGYAAAHNNLGVMYRLMHRPQAAVSHLQSAMRFDPWDATTAANLAHALIDLGKLSEAESVARSILSREPVNAEGHLMTGFAVAYQGRIEEAIAAFLEAHRLAPQSPMPVSNALFASLYSERRSARDVLELHCRLAAEIVPAVPTRTRWRNAPDPERVLRIGYLSPDLRSHPVSMFFEPVLANHDTQRFEIFCYSTSNAPDSVTGRLQRYACTWRDCQGQDDARLVAQIETDDIDILVDLAGHTAQNRVAVIRGKPAPVQVLYIGYPGTSGLPEVDYLIADGKICPPGLDDLYAERVARVDGSFWCFRPPDSAPTPGPSAASRNGHVTFGSFNALQKISDGVVASWAHLLQSVPESRLILKSLAFADGSTRRAVCQRFEAAGVDAARIDVLPPSESTALLGEYQRIDIALDPFPYNGGTTTCEALWMGVPVVTLAGERFCGRMGASLLCSVGLPELVAGSVDQYVDIAARLAGDVLRLEAIRATLRTRMAASALCDAQGAVRALERAYRAMWRAWCGAS